MCTKLLNVRKARQLFLNISGRNIFLHLAQHTADFSPGSQSAQLKNYPMRLLMNIHEVNFIQTLQGHTGKLLDHNCLIKKEQYLTGQGIKTQHFQNKTINTL